MMSRIRSTQLWLLHSKPVLVRVTLGLGLGLFASSCYGQHGGHGAVAGPTGFGAGHISTGRAAPGAMHRSGPPGTGIRGNRGRQVSATGSTTNSSAPMPTWELPRNITPQWEIPHTANTVLPNDVQGNRVPHARGGGFGVGYAVPYIIDPYAFGNDMYADDGYADQQQAPPANAGAPQYDPSLGGPEAPPRDTGAQGPTARAPYVPQETAVASNPGPITNGLDHPEVTLVFKDGRAPMKVQSYAVTGAAVYVAENGHQQRIPLSALDLAATVEQNRAAGVEFEVPGGGS
jgi:hypothetical protein